MWENFLKMLKFFTQWYFYSINKKTIRRSKAYKVHKHTHTRRNQRRFVRQVSVIKKIQNCHETRASIL